MAADSAHPVALVTGAGKRLGAAIATVLHAAGYQLVLHHRQAKQACEALANALNQTRAASACCVYAELSDTAHLPQLIDTALSHYGRLDALVNNASTFYPTPLAQATETQWHELFAANAQAPFFLIQAALPALRQQHGAIVNLTDIYAERALADYPLYVMAKAALTAMTRTLAIDLGPHVRINGVAPGAILWPSGGIPASSQQAIIANTPL